MNFIQKIKQLFGFGKTVSRKPDPDYHVDKPTEKRRDFSSGSPSTGSSSPIQPRQMPDHNIMQNFRH